jgi:protein MpaA
MRSTYVPEELEAPGRPETVDFGARIPSMRSIAQLLGTITEEARGSDHLFYSPVGQFHHREDRYRLARYVFLASGAGDDPIRIGLFAGIHGDEPEGSMAVVEFLRRLQRRPERAEGYAIFAYPLCNPTGFEDDTHGTRMGHDLNHELWQGSRQPEVYFLEREIGVIGFHVLVSLHSGPVNGVRIWSRSAIVRQHIVEPMTRAAEWYLPRAAGPSAGYCAAAEATGRSCHEGVLVSPFEVPSAPFEVVIETPKAVPEALQIEAAIAAVNALVETYRPFLSTQQNL